MKPKEPQPPRIAPVLFTCSQCSTVFFCREFGDHICKPPKDKMLHQLRGLASVDPTRENIEALTKYVNATSQPRHNKEDEF